MLDLLCVFANLIMILAQNCQRLQHNAVSYKLKYQPQVFILLSSSVDIYFLTWFHWSWWGDVRLRQNTFRPLCLPGDTYEMVPKDNHIVKVQNSSKLWSVMMNQNAYCILLWNQKDGTQRLAYYKITDGTKRHFYYETNRWSQIMK